MKTLILKGLLGEQSRKEPFVFVCLVLFLDKVFFFFFGSPVCPGAGCAGQAGLDFRDPPLLHPECCDKIHSSTMTSPVVIF